MPTASFADQPVILGFDPGRQKCGVAVMGLDRSLYYHEVVAAESAARSIVEKLRHKLPVSLVVMGNQTSSETGSNGSLRLLTRCA